MVLTYPYFKQAIMYSRLILAKKKSKLIAYLKSKFSIITIFLRIGPLFEVLYQEDYPGDFSLLQNGCTKTWGIRTNKSYCLSKCFPKAMSS